MQCRARAAAVGVTVIAAVACFATELDAGTIATFADPAPDASAYLFRIDLAADTVSAGWPDSNEGLTLEVIPSGQAYAGAFFTMTDVAYTGGLTGGCTGPGTVRFFRDGDDPLTADPLVEISFASAQLAVQGLTGDNTYDLHSDHDVAITVWEATGPVTLTQDAAFAFSFANQTPLAGGQEFDATAAFTSSATPEPATIAALLGGGIPLLVIQGFRRR